MATDLHLFPRTDGYYHLLSRCRVAWVRSVVKTVHCTSGE